MKESAIEGYLRDRIKQMGGKAYKWTSPGNVGVPDRIILLPNGVIVFAEVKAPGKKPTPKQLAVHAFLRKLGFKVYVPDSHEAVDAMLREVTPNEVRAT